MLAIALLFIVVPLAEIFTFIRVAHAIGYLDTFALLVLVSLFGAWLTKHEGFVVLRRLRTQLDARRTPTNELIDGVLVLAAGVLMFIPGFVTAGLGLLVLFPPTRVLFRTYLRRRFEVRVFGGPGDSGGNGVIDV